MSDLPPIGTIALPPVIVALVALAQRLGLPIKWAPWLNACLSVIGYALILFLAQRPEFQPIAQNVLTAIVVFLTAAGIFDRLERPVRKLEGRPARSLAGKPE